MWELNDGETVVVAGESDGMTTMVFSLDGFELGPRLDGTFKRRQGVRAEGAPADSAVSALHRGLLRAPGGGLR